MIKLFEKTATSFETNGIGLLTNYIFEPKVKEERNGYFAFTFKIPLHTKYGVKIGGEMIVTADCPGVGEQPFRIQKVIPSMGILSVEANHLFYDLADNFIEDINIVGANGQRAGQHILDNTAFPHNFTFRSDLANNYNCRIVRYNPVEAFLDDSKDNTFVSRWGGEIKRDKYEIIMNNMRGTDRGVRISNRKNLTGYEATIDYETVVTRIVPQGYDGLMLPEMYVDSPLIGRYTHPKIAVVQYAQIKAQTESEPKEDELPLEEAYEELRRLASEEFSEHHVDEPKATYKINIIDLRKTTEYKDFEQLEEILPWDWVTVDHDEDNLHVKARLQSYTWDPLLGMYVELTLGSVKSTVSGSMGKDVNYQDQIDQIRETSNAAMKTADGKNTIFIGLYGEDGTGEPTATKIGDLWFKPEDDQTLTKQWDGNAWLTISSTAPDPELVAAIEDNKKKVEDAKKAAEDAQKAGEDAQIAADDAKKIGQAAQDKANSAAGDATTALNKANDAVSAATDAAAKADQSVVASNQAKSDALTALGNADQAKENANTALTNSVNAINDAKNALDQYASLSFDSRNLLLDTAVAKDITGTGAENQLRTLAYLSKPTFGAYGFEIGKSVAFRVTTEISGSGFAGTFNFRLGSSKWVTLNPDGTRYSITKAETVTFEVVIPIVSGWENDRYVDIRLDNVPSTVNLHITEMQLTYSSEVLPWARAPEDVQVSIENLGNEVQLKVNLTIFNELSQTVSIQETAIKENSKEIELKANQTTVNALTGRVTNAEGSISTMAGQIELKANQSTVNSLTGRVTNAEGSISTMAGQIELKAEKSYVDTVKNSVDDVRSDLTVEAGKISALNTLTNGHTTQIGNLQSSYEGLSSTVSKVEQNVNGFSGNVNLFSLKSAASSTVMHPTQPAMPMIEILVDKDAYYTVSTDYPNRGTIDAPITDAWFIRATSTNPNSVVNGVYAGRSLTLPAIDTKIYIVFRTTAIRKRFLDGDYHLQVERGKVATDWTPSASDTATVIEFSNLTQTVNVIQGTVANKAEQSQVTQLAGQIQSLVSDRKPNLLVNSDFREGVTGWTGTGMSTMPIGTANDSERNKIGYPVQKFLRPTTESMAGTDAHAIQLVSNPENYKGKKLNFAFSYLTSPFANSPLQAVIRYTLDGTNYYVTFTGRSDYYLDISPTWKRVSTTVDFTNVLATQSLSDIRISISLIASRFTSAGQRCALTAFMATEDGNMYQWGYEYGVGLDYAQTTMLKDMIDLRVTKDDVVNQINISPDGVVIAGNKVQILAETYIANAVIKTANIADLAVNTAKIANLAVSEAKIGNLAVSSAKIKDAAITSAKIGTAAIGTAHIGDGVITTAKIGSLSADKITAGTLNGGNVNIINLNANNIVTGTITGQNLSINLTSGEVMFTKGSIRNADATFVMDIVTGVVSSRGTVLSPNSTGDLLPTGFDLMNGKLQFMNGSYGETSVVYGGIDTNTHYGQVLNSSSSWISGNYFSNAPTLIVNSGDQTSSLWQSWKKNVALGTTDFKELPMLSSGVKAGLGLTGSKNAYDQNIIGGSIGIVSNATASVSPDGFAQTKAVIQARNGIYMSSGFHYQVSGNSVSILTPASIRIGDTTNDNGSADAQKQSAASIFAQGHTFTFKGDTVDLWANHHKLRGLYSATKSASANIYLDTDGTLYRATSARKYKTSITIADDVIQHAKKVLSIQPSSWFDKSEIGHPNLERRYGFIADEFHEAGLKEVVVYNGNEIESLAYDRIPMYHNVILNEHDEKIQSLENEVKNLKMEIERLKAA